MTSTKDNPPARARTPGRQRPRVRGRRRGRKTDAHPVPRRTLQTLRIRPAAALWASPDAELVLELPTIAPGSLDVRLNQGALEVSGRRSIGATPTEPRELEVIGDDRVRARWRCGQLHLSLRGDEAPDVAMISVSIFDR